MRPRVVGSEHAVLLKTPAGRTLKPVLIRGIMELQALVRGGD